MNYSYYPCLVDALMREGCLEKGERKVLVVNDPGLCMLVSGRSDVICR